jgi:hypothetical protein
MPKKKPAKAEEPKLNREQRRRQKFGGVRADAEGGWPSSRPNPAFGESGEEAAEATAPAAPPVEPPPVDVENEPRGPGTGGATEQAGRVARHEGTHATNSAKG